MNLILKLLIEKRKNDLLPICRLPSKSDKSFCFQARVQGDSKSVSVWKAKTATEVGLLVFYDG